MDTILSINLQVGLSFLHYKFINSGRAKPDFRSIIIGKIYDEGNIFVLKD